MPLLNPQPYYKKYKIEDIEEIILAVPDWGMVKESKNNGSLTFINCAITIKEKEHLGEE